METDITYCEKCQAIIYIDQVHILYGNELCAYCYNDELLGVDESENNDER